VVDFLVFQLDSMHSDAPSCSGNRSVL